MKTEKTHEITTFIWLIAAIIIFTLAGILIAKTQLGIDKYSGNKIPITKGCETATATGCEPYLIGNTVVAANQKEKNTMLQYGAIGTVIGIGVGLFNASYRKKQP